MGAHENLDCPDLIKELYSTRAKEKVNDVIVVESEVKTTSRGL